VTEINLEFNTDISLLIVDKYSWDNGMYSIMSIKNEVEQDGVKYKDKNRLQLAKYWMEEACHGPFIFVYHLFPLYKVRYG
jgi:hypothetical protein